MGDNSAAAGPDNPGVVGMPPWIALATLVVGLGLERLVPVGILAGSISRTPRLIAAAVLFALAFWVALRAVREFSRAGTNVDVRKPVLAFVDSGIYAHTRNPMYQGLGLLLVAVAVGFASDWMLVMLIPWAFVMHFGVVLREERYLEQKFGERYRRYKTMVPRYGWPQ